MVCSGRSIKVATVKVATVNRLLYNENLRVTLELFFSHRGFLYARGATTFSSVLPTQRGVGSCSRPRRPRGNYFFRSQWSLVIFGLSVCACGLSQLTPLISNTFTLTHLIGTPHWCRAVQRRCLAQRPMSIPDNFVASVSL